MTAVPSVPRASASVAALIMLAGLALVYWSLTGLGVFVAQGDDAPGAAGGLDTMPFTGGGFGGGSSGNVLDNLDGGGGAGGGF